MRASQPGDATYAAALPVDQSFTVSKASSTLAVATSANPSPTGANVTFTATASSSAGTPTGTVQFLADGTALGVPAGLSGGSASVSSATLAHGHAHHHGAIPGGWQFFRQHEPLAPSQLINSPPVAVPDPLQRYLNSGVKVRVATLLANDTDPEGDGVTFSSVNPTSAAGGTVVAPNSWIFYTPPPGFTNADSFAYVIADSGGLQATGAVAITIIIDSNVSQNVVAIDDLGSHTSRIHFQGIVGRVYTIQYTENLGTPVWQPLGTRTADATGTFEFTDAPGSGSPARFYRSTYP